MKQELSALAELLPTALSSRTLYVKCAPSPASFTERRAILRTIQKATSDGVEVFRKLKDDSSFIVVTNKPETATQLVNESPLQRTIITGEQKSTGAGDSTLASWGSKFNRPSTIAEPINPIPTKDAVATSGTGELGLAYRTLTLRCFPANQSYNHAQVVKNNPLHGPWPDTVSRSKDTFISSALRRTVPAGSMAPALRDWETGDQLSRDNTSFAEEASEGASSLLFGRTPRKMAAQAFYKERERTRRQKEDTPDVMLSPWAYAEKCRNEQSPSTDPTQKDMEGGDTTAVSQVESPNGTDSKESAG